MAVFRWETISAGKSPFAHLRQSNLAPTISVPSNPVVFKRCFRSSGRIKRDQSCVPRGMTLKMISPSQMINNLDQKVLLKVSKNNHPPNNNIVPEGISLTMILFNNFSSPAINRKKFRYLIFIVFFHFIQYTMD